MDAPLVFRFEGLGMAEVARVGGKNASLGEMVRELTARGVRVPGGFATSADAYRTGELLLLQARPETVRAGRSATRSTIHHLLRKGRVLAVGSAVVGTGDASRRVTDDQELTVCCAEGDRSTVHEGLLPFIVEEADLGALPGTSTAVMVNVAGHAAALRSWRLPAAPRGRAAERPQDRRVRPPGRRVRVRGGRGGPDARLPRGVPLRRPP